MEVLTPGNWEIRDLSTVSNVLTYSKNALPSRSIALYVARLGYWYRCWALLARYLLHFQLFLWLSRSQEDIRADLRQTSHAVVWFEGRILLTKVCVFEDGPSELRTVGLDGSPGKLAWFWANIDLVRLYVALVLCLRVTYSPNPCLDLSETLCSHGLQQAAFVIVARHVMHLFSGS